METIKKFEVDAGTEGTAVVDMDGLALFSNLPKAADEVVIAAMAAAILGVAERANRELGRGELQRIIIEGDNGRTILTGCGEDALMVTLTPEKTKLGIVLMELGRASKKISESLK